MDMTQNDGRETLKPYQLVYLYHNTVDKAGHSDDPLRAGREALNELRDLVKRLCNSLNITNVIVTADHGFLYQATDLHQATKLDVPSDIQGDRTRRGLLGRNLPQLAGTLWFELPQLEPAGFEVVVPRDTLRFKLSGSDGRYVHGGASLQEICVPVLRYKHTRPQKGDEGASQKTNVTLVASGNRITNQFFKVKLMRSEPVSGRVRPRTVAVGLYDVAGKLVSDQKTVVLDSASADAPQREQTVTLQLAMGDVKNGDTCYLIVRDADDGLEQQKAPRRVSLAITDDLGDL